VLRVLDVGHVHRRRVRLRLVSWICL
jgi:hypothetical protein